MELVAQQAAERADAAQRESDHDRWNDDGGFMPEPEASIPALLVRVVRTPWIALGIAVGAGVVLGWLTKRR